MRTTKYFKSDFFTCIQILHCILCNHPEYEHKIFFKNIKHCKCFKMKNKYDFYFKYHLNAYRNQHYKHFFAKYFQNAIDMILFARKHNIEVYPGRTLSVLYRVVKSKDKSEKFIRIYIALTDTNDINKNRINLAWWNGEDFNSCLKY